MKKSLAVVAASMLLALPLAFQETSKPVELQAYEPVGLTNCSAGFVTVDVRFHKWDGDYSNVAAWTWGNGTGGTVDAVKVSAVDDFGATFRYCVDPGTAGETAGFIPVTTSWDGSANNFWADAAKLTANTGDGNMYIPYDLINAGWNSETSTYSGPTHLEFLTFEGGIGVSGAFYVNPTKKNILIGYFDPANAYEENLGIHPWGPYDAPLNAGEWGTPVQFFIDGAKAPSGVPVKLGMVTAAADATGLGGLFYAGGNDSKKHPATDSFADPSSGFAETGAGEVAFALVVNGLVFDNPVDFSAEAFKFEFMPREVMDSGLAEGTFAVDPNTVLVKTNVKVAVDDDKDAVKARFTLTEGENVIAISSVDYDVRAASTNSFVLNLGSNLNITKTYMLAYDDGVNTTEFELDLDRTAPVITFLNANVDVEIELGGAWDADFVPSFVATDNRDGDITALVYIAAGEGYVNTGIVGDYVVKFTVFDKWGNKGQASFTVSVVEPEVTGGCATTAEGGNNGIGLLVSLLGAAWLLKKSALGVAK